MSGLPRGGTAEPVSRDQSFGRDANGDGREKNIAGHEKDRQPHTVADSSLGDVQKV